MLHTHVGHKACATAVCKLEAQHMLNKLCFLEAKGLEASPLEVG